MLANGEKVPQTPQSLSFPSDTNNTRLYIAQSRHSSLLDWFKFWSNTRMYIHQSLF